MTFLDSYAYLFPQGAVFGGLFQHLLFSLREKHRFGSANPPYKSEACNPRLALETLVRQLRTQLSTSMLSGVFRQRQISPLQPCERLHSRPDPADGTWETHMRLSTVTKRVTMLENTLTRLRIGQKSSGRSGKQMDDSTVPVLKQLQNLAQETKRIKEQTVASEDYRTALACIRELCRMLELIAKLGGELDEKTQTNILNVTLDSETGKRIAEMYLTRLRNQEAK